MSDTIPDEGLTPEPAEGLTPGTGADAATLALVHVPLPASDVVSGNPTTAVHPLALLGGTEVGIWEMTPGTASDTETDEVFVVLSGRARIAFDDPDLPDLDVSPGSVVRLAEGQRTVWTVTETLRKIYIA
ncbi:cupin domain-containing protein [Microbacterium galbinum]|uniref:cupin domain-containing protein n=1 Tax=Microbacterium galbinum TaxID=2851646 RepID=UPI001FFCE46E|nr:cupin domain-containing protein [Microbacterium galbinum]